MESIKKMGNVILVPTDFTVVGDTAINHAVGLAKASDNSLKIIHVINEETKAKLIFISNLMSKKGQTRGLTLESMLSLVEG
jgi:nucleotide-binding universal stress UspA family protein